MDGVGMSQAEPDPERPTGSAVLVHGAMGSPIDWLWVRRPLEAAGLQVVAPDLPSHGSSTAGLPDDAELVRAAVRECTRPVVVVGWSYGGEVITAAADGEPAVVGLLYVNTVPRDAGFVEDVGWLDGNEHLLWFDDGTYVLDDRWWREDEAGATFPAEVREVLRTHPRRRISPGAMANVQIGAAWRTIPTVVLMGRSDWFLTDAEHDWMSAQDALDLRMVDCDHFLLFRRPQLVADTVLELLART